MSAVAPLINLTNSDSDAINKVAVVHLYQGCILEVDLEHPRELHELHNEYPLAPARLCEQSRETYSKFKQ